MCERISVSRLNCASDCVAGASGACDLVTVEFMLRLEVFLTPPRKFADHQPVCSSGGTQNELALTRHGHFDVEALEKSCTHTAASKGATEVPYPPANFSQK